MMRRMVFDLGEVRLQAPEGWIRLESRGKRIVLRDPCYPTPIFFELLYRIERVDRWIAALATGGKRITGFQQTPDFSARRFVLEGTEAVHLVQYLENDGRPCWPPPCAGSGGGSPFNERTHRW